MKIKNLSDSSKPRERFLKHGKEALSDAEHLCKHFYMLTYLLTLYRGIGPDESRA